MTLSGRGIVRHAEVAAELRAYPGEEQLVGEYADRDSARVMAQNIRVARLAAYQPAGSFEARFVPSDGGAWEVHARYVGEPKEAAA